MKKKRIMVVGRRASGKTTIVNFLNDYKGPLKRTADVIYGEKTMDIPSSYLESPWMYKHIIALSQDAKKIVYVLDSKNPKETISDGFTKLFNLEVVGVINKARDDEKNIKTCKETLKRIGINEPYFLIRENSEVDMKYLKEYLLK